MMKGTKRNLFQLLFLSILVLGSSANAQQEFLYGDQMPDAPELSAKGEHTIGVRTMQLVNKDQVDILNQRW